MDILKRATKRMGRVVTNKEAAEYACQHISISVKNTSWNVYKSNHLRSISCPTEREAVRTIYKTWDSRPGKPVKKRKKLQRNKSISDQDLDALIDELRDTERHRHGLRAIAWLKMCHLTGCRPVEASGARIIMINGQRMCRLRNAKTSTSDNLNSNNLGITTGGRNHTLYRNIPINSLDSQQIEAIKIAIYQATLATQKGIYNEFYDVVRKTINRGARNLGFGSPLPSLYTMRHSFKDRWTASLESAGLSFQQKELVIAVLMGHGSRKTQYAYGLDDDSNETNEDLPSVIANLSPQIQVLLRRITSPIQ